jgi:hypothetical protein
MAGIKAEYFCGGWLKFDRFLNDCLDSKQILHFMRNLLIHSIAFLTISVYSYGQDTTQLKRIPYKLIVAVDKNTSYEEEIKATPYVLPNKTIQLYPGETVYIEVQQENGNIKSMTAVKEIKNPAITLTISFTQTARKNIHEMTMLKVVNPFSTQLTYKAKIFLLNPKKWVDTNVYPVEAGLSAFETWPDIITSIGLGDWVFKTN